MILNQLLMNSFSMVTLFSHFSHFVSFVMLIFQRRKIFPSCISTLQRTHMPSGYCPSTPPLSLICNFPNSVSLSLYWFCITKTQQTIWQEQNLLWKEGNKLRVQRPELSLAYKERRHFWNSNTLVIFVQWLFPSLKDMCSLKRGEQYLNMLPRRTLFLVCYSFAIFFYWELAYWLSCLSAVTVAQAITVDLHRLESRELVPQMLTSSNNW